ncbi:MAG: putative zinc-binding metallopeptidase [Prevotella sp.]|jgi:substrate import-associated zinc metallohydrolase lipoprotein|nr:putative zinc-binding metallopeptidase [Prevotella sp.]
MNKYVNILHKTAYILLFGVFAVSCEQSDDSFTETIFVDEPATDPSSKFYAFDRWLEDNYMKPYNLDFMYKMSDAGSDITYNLVPTELERAKRLAILIKYLWFDAYGEVAGHEFLQQYGPRMIHLIGSGAYNPRLGTVMLGSAEGGVEVTLYECNSFDPANISMDVLNEYFFKTMHHEFAHILHQQRTYPKEFESYSAGYYDPSYWQERTNSVAASLGFASPYGSSQPREDFVEIIANYIVQSDAWWAKWMDLASKPGIDGAGEVVAENLDGKAILETKIGICRKWLKESWSIDLDSMRAVVGRRQLHISDAIAQGYAEIESYNE